MMERGQENIINHIFNSQDFSGWVIIRETCIVPCPVKSFLHNKKHRLVFELWGWFGTAAAYQVACQGFEAPHLHYSVTN